MLWRQRLDRRWVHIVGWSAVLFGLLPLALHRLGWTNTTEAIYIATGIAIVWYTVETSYLRREVFEQNKITRAQAESAISPLLVLRTERVPALSSFWRAGSGPPTYQTLVLRNIGNGPALFATLEPITVYLRGQAWRVVFRPVDLVEAGDIATLLFDASGGEGTAEHSQIVQALTPAHERQSDSYQVMIRYEDVNKRRLESIMRIAQGAIELLRYGSAT